MKNSALVIGGIAAVIVIAIGVYMIDIDQTEQARLPDVELKVDGGNLPKFDANVGSVSITEEEVSVEVPEVKVTTEEKTFKVPGLKVTPPAND